jgi:hypothetical protein
VRYSRSGPYSYRPTRFRDKLFEDRRPLLPIFDVDPSGTNVSRRKPDPALLRLATFTAADAGRMASLGVARLGDKALLESAEAARVVSSSDQVDTAAVSDGVLSTQPYMETSAHA